MYQARIILMFNGLLALTRPTGCEKLHHYILPFICFCVHVNDVGRWNIFPGYIVAETDTLLQHIYLPLNTYRVFFNNHNCGKDYHYNPRPLPLSPHTKKKDYFFLQSLHLVIL